MKIIKLKFVDFWPGFDPIDNYFYRKLSSYYIIDLTDQPDYLIYSVFGDKHLDYNCIRIFYTGENIEPDFNLCDYAVGFSHIHYDDRYLRFPIYAMYEKDYQDALIKHLISDQQIASKDLFCDFIYSNHNAEDERVNFYKKLSAYKRVEAGGACLNNIGYRVPDKRIFQSRCKFSIAFENSSTVGYTTEKIIQPFAAGAIPIYWGNPEIAREFNPESFINCHMFSSFDDVVEEVKRIDQDDEQYIKMLKSPVLEIGNSPIQAQALIEFFANIFDQPIGKARRRIRSTRVESYEHRIKFSYYRSRGKIFHAIWFSLFTKRHHKMIL